MTAIFHFDDSAGSYAHFVRMEVSRDSRQIEFRHGTQSDTATGQPKLAVVHQRLNYGRLKELTLLFSAFAVFFGLIIGSFLNVVIHRGPALWRLVDDDSRRGNLAFPRSYCPACAAPIQRQHLAPLVSYIALRGKCASCGAGIPIRYPIVEFLGAAAALGAYLLFGATITALLAAIFFWFLIALAFIDFETGFLPDALTLPLILVGIVASAAGYFAPIIDAVAGAIVGFVVFRAVGALFYRLRGIEGLGQGDAKLLAAIGAWLGWQAIAPTVLVAALIGLAGALIMRLLGKEITGATPIPFGPALAISSALILILAGILPEGSLILSLRLTSP